MSFLAIRRTVSLSLFLAALLAWPAWAERAREKSPATGRSGSGTVVSRSVRGATDKVALQQRISGMKSRIREARSLAKEAVLRSALTLKQQVAYQSMKAASPDMQVWLRKDGGAPRHLKGRLMEARSGSRSESAREFLRRSRDLLLVEDPDREFSPVREEIDQLGRSHIRFRQSYRGIPVWPSEIIVHLDADGVVDVFDGSSIPTPADLTTQPAVGAGEALLRAYQAVPTTENTTASDPELIVFSSDIADPRLAWKTEVTVSPSAIWLVVVDAEDGSILNAFNRVNFEDVAGAGTDLLGQKRNLRVWKQGSTYYMADTSKPMFKAGSDPLKGEKAAGVILILDAANTPPNSDPDPRESTLNLVTSANQNNFTLKDAVSTGWGLSEIYDFYRERFNRNSLDGAGSSMFAVVRLGKNFDNAFWNGAAMFFGDAVPYAGALDVVAHEMTHGVTEKSAGLIYQSQSGALNEAMSDIFGEMVEAYASGSNDWLSGTGLPAAFRSFITPELYDQPSRMSDFVNTSQDNGGVHINSGIINHAFYLLAVGQQGAIGSRKASDIFYRALTTHLVANSQFIDARLACVTSAEELYGKGTSEVQKVGEAFDAVEIYDTEKPPPTPTPDPVNASDSLLVLYWDTTAQDYLLARREAALGDPTPGVTLSATPMLPRRPSVTGDGELALVVSADKTICFVFTGKDPQDESGESCAAELNGQIYAAAMSASGEWYAVILLDDNGDPYDVVGVFDIVTENEPRIFQVGAPAPDTPDGVGSVLWAESLAFTRDSRLLFYDAVSALTVGNSQAGYGWGIYGLDLSSEVTRVIAPPGPDVSYRFPNPSQTGKTLVVFDAFKESTNSSDIYSADYLTGSTVKVASVTQGLGVPGFSGDDRSVYFSQYDSSVWTEYSIYVQQLTADGQHPTGSSSLSLPDGDFSQTYRRGTFTAPQGTPVADAGLPQEVAEGAKVILNGLGSTDPNGDLLIYNWIQKSGPIVKITDADKAVANFNAPSVSQDTILSFTLNVSDGTASSQDSVDVTVKNQSGAADESVTLIFPQFANGLAGIPLRPNRTRLVLRNNSGALGTGIIQFRNDAGAVVPMPVNNQSLPFIPYVVDPWGTYDVQTDGTGNNLVTGAIEVIAQTGVSSALRGTALFDILGNFVSVDSARPGTCHQVYVSVSSQENTGVAWFNPSAVAQSRLRVSLYDKGGAQRATAEVTLNPKQHSARFADDATLFKTFFQQNPAAFTGTLGIQVLSGSPIAVTGLIQKRATGALISVPPTPELPGTSCAASLTGWEAVLGM